MKICQKVEIPIFQQFSEPSRKWHTIFFWENAIKKQFSHLKMATSNKGLLNYSRKLSSHLYKLCFYASVYKTQRYICSSRFIYELYRPIKNLCWRWHLSISLTCAHTDVHLWQSWTFIYISREPHHKYMVINTFVLPLHCVSGVWQHRDKYALFKIPAATSAQNFPRARTVTFFSPSNSPCTRVCAYIYIYIYRDKLFRRGWLWTKDRPRVYFIYMYIEEKFAYECFRLRSCGGDGG